MRPGIFRKVKTFASKVKGNWRVVRIEIYKHANIWLRADEGKILISSISFYWENRNDKIANFHKVWEAKAEDFVLKKFNIRSDFSNTRCSEQTNRTFKSKVFLKFCKWDETFESN